MTQSKHRQEQRSLCAVRVQIKIPIADAVMDMDIGKKLVPGQFAADQLPRAMGILLFETFAAC
eukprot:4844210-Karenia_brevis.AAC.1